MPVVLAGQLENESMVKSSKKSRLQVLGVISAARAEQLLTEWINTDIFGLGGSDAWARLFRKYPEIPSLPLIDGDWDEFHEMMEDADCIAGWLAKAWETKDRRVFEWYTWKAQAEYEWSVVRAKHKLTPSHLEPDPIREKPKMMAALLEVDQPPATASPVEAAIFHLRQNQKRALHCPNADCPAPYFFSSKKGQVYCSSECAKPSQRESKRRWWAENRAKRSPKSTSSHRRSR